MSLPEERTEPNIRASSPSLEEGGTGRRSHRPEAPAFSFGPQETLIPRLSEPTNLAPKPSADPLGVVQPQHPPSPPRPATAVAAPAATALPHQASSTTGVCTVCGSPNPASYRYCATCGGTVKTGATAGTPIASPARSPEAPAPKDDSAAPIVGAPVLGIADATEPAPVMVTCARCHGQCSGGARFCKYCGALLGASAEPQPKTPPADPAELSALASAPSTLGSAPSPAAPTPAAPTRTGDDLAQAPAAASSAHRPVPPPPPSQQRRQAALAAAGPSGTPVSPTPVAPIPAGPTTPGGADSMRKGGLERPPASPIAEAAAATFVGTSRLEEPAFLGRLVVLIEDGSEGKSYELEQNQVDIGRTEGDIALFDDEYVSPRHARLLRVDGRWYVRDLGSTNGVYARTSGQHPLENGDLILLGLQVLQFHPVSEAERNQGAALRQGALQHGTRLFGSKPARRLARLEQRTIEGVVADVYNLFRDETVIGREVGDIVFTSDPFLSRKHAIVRRSDDVFSIEDLGSSNGTYVGIKRDTVLEDGARIRVGQHLFRVDLTRKSGTEKAQAGGLHTEGVGAAQPTRGSKNAS